MSNVISMDVNDKVAHIHIDDGHYNVLDLERCRDLLSFVRQADEDPAIKSLIIEGNSKTLSAGLDLRTMLEGGDDAAAMLVTMRDILAVLYASATRVVAICTGHAVAAGAMLLLVSDHRIGVRGNVKIGFSEVAHGLAVPRLPVLLVRDRVAADQQFAATALSRMYTSETAVAAGFLDEVVDGLQLARDRAARVAGELAELDDAAYLQTLLNLREDTLARLHEVES